jgi:hypothetical protein
MTEVTTNVPDVIPGAKKRGRPRKVIVPQEPEEPQEPQEPEEPPVHEPQEPALETIQEDKEEPPPKEPPTPTPTRRRVKKPPSQPVRMKTPVHPTAREIAGELGPVMMRHLEDRHFSRQQQRRALYASWL